jgi:hypothetical protein
MGGYVLCNSDGERLYPLDLENIENLIQSGAIDFPKITKDEIEDKSKGNIVSKGLAIIQTGWFIMQCIARGASHLAITELEIMTVAFAFLNLVTYVFWWNKPLDVTCPVRIVLKEGHRAPEPRSPERVSLWSRFGRMFSLYPDQDDSDEGHSAPEPRPQERVGLLDRVWWMFTLIDPERDNEVDLLREKQVPTFYAGPVPSQSRDALLIAEILIAVIFGGIHCIAWSFSFPTRVEQIFWRVSSIATISTPFLILVIFPADPDVPDIFQYLLLIFLSLVYIFSRLALLILSFISLRSLPPSAFYTVYWTNFIPHVG